jgi:hypothetical protein
MIPARDALRAILCVAASVAWGIAACSSSSSPQAPAVDAGGDGAGGSSGSSGSSSGAFSGGCIPANGTYKVTYTQAATNGSSCTSISPTTETYPLDAGEEDAGLGCTQTCTGTTQTDVCTLSSMGITTTTNITLTFTSTGATGTSSETVTSSDAGVIESCAYSITVTMQ